MSCYLLSLPWDTLEVLLFWGSKVKCQGHRVSSKFISHTRTLHTRTAILRHSLGGVKSRRRGIELGIECLLVIHADGSRVSIAIIRVLSLIHI